VAEQFGYKSNFPIQSSIKNSDLNQLDLKSIRIMNRIVERLEQKKEKIQDFFQPVIFEKEIKTKTDTRTYQLISSEHFFGFLQQQGLKKYETEHKNLSAQLSVDQNKYPDRILLSKL